MKTGARMVLLEHTRHYFIYNIAQAGRQDTGIHWAVWPPASGPTGACLRFFDELAVSFYTPCVLFFVGPIPWGLVLVSALLRIWLLYDFDGMGEFQEPVLRLSHIVYLA